MTDSKIGNKANKLVVFDVEGILLPKNRFLLFEMSRKVGFFGFVKVLVLGFLYEINLLSLESALRKIFFLFEGIQAKQVLELYKTIPLLPGTAEVFKKLKESGFKTALISSGLPNQVVEDLATRLQADYAYGLEIEVINERLTGVISGDVLKSKGKASVLKNILEKESFTPENCIMVADDRNNRSMFPLCKLKIGYNPDFILAAKSDIVIKSSLLDILPMIIGEKTPVFDSNLSSNGIRQVIHIGSFFLIFVSIFLIENTFLAYFLLFVALLYTISEFARIRGINIPIFYIITRKAANKTELFEFATAPIYFALGIALSLLIFPESISYVAITTLTLGDGGAHIFGMKYGRTKLPFNKGKNLEGTFFGVILAFLCAMIFVDPLKALIAVSFGMLIEGLPIPINDNFSIPLASGLILTLIL